MSIQFDPSLSSQQLYNQHKNRLLKSHEGIIGIIAGYDRNDLIIALKGEEKGWLPDDKHIIFDGGQNNKGYWYVSPYQIITILETFKFGR